MNKLLIHYKNKSYTNNDFKKLNHDELKLLYIFFKYHGNNKYHKNNLYKLLNYLSRNNINIFK